VPFNAEKFALEGDPSVVIRFLGVMIDTLQQIAYLDAERMAEIRKELKEFASKTSATRKELQSLIALSCISRPRVPARCGVVASVHGRLERQSLWYDEQWTHSDALQLYTDASVSGYGTVYCDQWFNGVWSAEQLAEAKRVKRESMPYLELLRERKEPPLEGMEGGIIGES
jgi:hypothetical protein